MEPEGVPALLEALFIYNKAEALDKSTKAALRLCSKHFKNLVDATAVEAEKDSEILNRDLNVLLNTEWHGIKILRITEGFDCQNRLTELPSALFVKFSRLETLEIFGCRALEALPEEIGDLPHLKKLEIVHCRSFAALPSSLGKLTTLEEIAVYECNLTVESLAPLQHFTGLTSLNLGSYRYDDTLIKFPDLIWNFKLLKTLHLSSLYVTTLPDALGNLTNLESLGIYLHNLKQLPESIGNLHALKDLHIISHRLTTLPESLDDLLWRKAHETEESKKLELVDFSPCPNLVFSATMKQALELLKRNGADIRWP